MIKVLIVDDYEDFRSILVRAASEGWEIEESADGRDAIQKIDEHHYDLILLDYQMPHANGLEVLDNIRDSEMNAKAIVIGISSIGDCNDEMIKHGANWSYTKGQIIRYQDDFISRVNEIVDESLES